MGCSSGTPGRCCFAKGQPSCKRTIREVLSWSLAAEQAGFGTYPAWAVVRRIEAERDRALSTSVRTLGSEVVRGHWRRPVTGRSRTKSPTADDVAVFACCTAAWSWRHGSGRKPRIKSLTQVVGGRSRHGTASLPGVRIADRVLEGVTCIRLDASVVTCHSDKELAEPNFKGFGYHPLLAYCDNSGEPLAGMLRKGSAGSNTVADHLAVLEAAIAALPPAFRRTLMVTCDGAGASHGLIARLDQLAARRGYQLTYSVGWELGERERPAIRAGARGRLADRRRSARRRSASAAPVTPAATAAARTANAGSRRRTSPS